MGSRREAPRLCPACGVPVWRGSWQAALLAASILSSCFLLNQAQSGSSTEISVTWKPLEPIQGQNVTLTPGEGLENIVFCNWYRATTTDLEKRIFVYYLPPSPLGQINGAAYTGRETGSPDCSLHIRNLTSADTGNYTVTKEGAAIMIGHANIVVSEILSKPILTPDKNRTVENETVILQCKTSSNPKVNVSWFKDGKPVPDTAELSDMNRTLTLLNITKDDAGDYTCVASNPVSSESSNPANIVVAYGPYDVHLNQPGTLTVNLGSNLDLLCIADSFPLHFQWFFNNTDQKVANDTFSVPLTAWEDQGNYTCQAYNSDTNRAGSASVIVKLTENTPGTNNGLSGGAIAGIVIGCVAGVVLISGLVYFLCAKTSLGRTEQHVSNGNIPSAPGHNQGVTDTKPRSGEEDIQYSTLAFKANNPPQPAPGPTHPLEGNIIYSEIRKK